MSRTDDDYIDRMNSTKYDCPLADDMFPRCGVCGGCRRVLDEFKPPKTMTPSKAQQEQADKIGRLEARVAELTEALERIIEAWDSDDDWMGSDPAEIARTALGRESDGR